MYCLSGVFLNKFKPELFKNPGKWSLIKLYGATFLKGKRCLIFFLQHIRLNKYIFILELGY